MIDIRTDLRIPASLRRLEEMPRTATQDALSTARDFLREEARRNVSKGGSRGLKVRSGRLFNSIRTYFKATPEGAQLSLGSVFYGGVLNRGITIYAKKAPYLRFYIPGVGWRQSRSVTIPAHPWADDAAAALRERFPSYLGQAVRRRVA